MMREISWMLLVLLAFSVYAEDGKAVVVGSAEELKGISAKKIIWQKDGAKMALVPAGSFEMGDHLNGMGDALPVHAVELDTFYIDIYEVTVGQFKQFVDENGYSYNYWDNVAKYSPGDEYPIVYVSWDDAVAYCNWVGKRFLQKRNGNMQLVEDWQANAIHGGMRLIRLWLGCMIGPIMIVGTMEEEQQKR